MSSDRPRTPPRSSYSYFGDKINEKISADTHPRKTSSGYVPHVFDLVYPAHDAISLSKKHIPPIFFEAEAVDSSVLLGHGASFTASLQKIPQGPESVEVTTHFPGWSMTRVQPAPSRPAYVVYKIARVAFDKNGEPLPEYRRAMQNVLTEFHALINPRLCHHANVIDFLGIAWGSNPFSSQHRLPALIVEYAEHGTLTQLLRKNKKLDFKIKHLLCLDIARGLSALHQAGLVHGDVKTDNILICSGPNRKYVAKISDFGFSIIAATESAEVWMGGTDPWRAPEVISGPVRLGAAKQADTYSFGLMAWSMCLDGQNPFNFVTEKVMENEEVEELKKSGRLLSFSKGRAWLCRYLQVDFVPMFEQFYEKSAGMLSNQQLSPDNARVQLMAFFPKVRDQLIENLAAQTVDEMLVRSLNDIFDVSLPPSADSRDLDSIILVLESDTENPKGGSKEPEENTNPLLSLIKGVATLLTNHTEEKKHFSRSAITEQNTGITADAKGPADTVDDVMTTRSPKPEMANGDVQDLAFWVQRGYKHRWLSWQKTRDLQPSVQNFVVSSFDGSKNSENSPELFVLCAYYMNGYGCKPDVTMALAKLQQAVDLGHHLSRAFLHRIWAACRPQEENPGRSYLEVYAKAGSRPALEELRKVESKEKIEFVERWVTDTSGGVGADWLDSSEMLDGHTQSQWIVDEWLMDKVRSADRQLSQLIINRRGDTVLHFVAMCGRWKPFKTLILDYKMDINLQNPLGETPLLCACRSGHGGIVIYCLRNFEADAAIAAKNGETPVHWLIHFEDQYIEPMLKDLIANGARIDARTTKRVSHSRYPGNVDVDFQMPGTALSWAVHANRPHVVLVLLNYGADPNLTPEDGVLSALEMSAYYHHHECLKVMIGHLESKVTQKTSDGQVEKRYAVMYGPLVVQAQRAADKFSMVLRGGDDYLNRLHATFDFLREKTEYVSFEGQVQGSLLYTAVSQAHDELVEYMFEHKWLNDTINRPVGDARRTPVLEAIRWNREILVQTLINHGADINALAANPFSPESSNWSALHIFAHEGHDGDVTLVSKLVGFGLPVDGPAGLDTLSATEDPQSSNKPHLDSCTSIIVGDNGTAHEIETPFAIAVRHNAFNLATKFLSLGADPNSLTIASGLSTSAFLLTVLGHVIISNARYSLSRINYLLHLEGNTVDFIVEPARKLTALHRCAMAHLEVSKRTGGTVSKWEFDIDTNADIMYELLMKWKRKEERDAICEIEGNTALHLAVQTQNLSATQSLLEAGAATQIRNEKGETAYQLAKRVNDGCAEATKIEAVLLRFEA